MAGKGARSNATLLARIKRMMQSDEDVGKVAKASPVLIGARSFGTAVPRLLQGCPTSQVAHPAAPAPTRHPAAKALDVFLHGLVEGAAGIAAARGARMLTPSHM